MGASIRPIPYFQLHLKNFYTKPALFLTAVFFNK